MNRIKKFEEFIKESLVKPQMSEIRQFVCDLFMSNMEYTSTFAPVEGDEIAVEIFFNVDDEYRDIFEGLDLTDENGEQIIGEQVNEICVGIDIEKEDFIIKLLYDNEYHIIKDFSEIVNRFETNHKDDRLKLKFESSDNYFRLINDDDSEYILRVVEDTFVDDVELWATKDENNRCVLHIYKEGVSDEVILLPFEDTFKEMLAIKKVEI